MNENFNIINVLDENIIDNFSEIDPNDILEIFAFKDEENIISYEYIEYWEEKSINVKLSDLILKNLFVDLKRFSQNKFDSNSEDILFTNITF